MCNYCKVIELIHHNRFTLPFFLRYNKAYYNLVRKSCSKKVFLERILFYIKRTRSKRFNKDLPFLIKEKKLRILLLIALSIVKRCTEMFREPVEQRLISSAYEHIDTGFVTASLEYHYYINHLHETPITGRKRLIFLSNKKIWKVITNRMWKGAS